MKKAYITPLTKVAMLESEVILASSSFKQGSASQGITLTDEEYDDEFATKSAFEGDFWE